MSPALRFAALQAVRVGVAAAVVFSVPVLGYVVVQEIASRRYATAALAYTVHTALLYPAGMLVGHLKQDSAWDFGVGASYLWFLGGGLYILIQAASGPFGARDLAIGAMLILAGVPPFALGVAGVHRTRGLQARRRAAGQCVACGYDLAGLRGAERCPECGAPLRPTPRPGRTPAAQRGTSE